MSAIDNCFWGSGCANSERCMAHGTCIAREQRKHIRQECGLDEPLYTKEQVVREIMEHPHRLKIQKWRTGTAWGDCNYVEEVLELLK